MRWTLEERFREIADRHHLHPVAAAVFRLGDRAARMHLVTEGAVHLIRRQSDGTALVLQRAGPGAILAEASLYSELYHCDAVAALPTQSVSVDKSDLRAHLHADPHFHDAWSRHLGGALMASRLHAQILSLRTVAARLDAWLDAHDDELQEKGGWLSLACEIGVSPEALYREFARRRRNGGRPG